ncbi:hypothetical protein AVEN_103070-1 [Araneus ventricosus]|uniref:Uncharacterized protein n=1 Tax=Araneus ventricosus TaxID=182803 RepID=A0A4Y2B8A4_ARAVE|nr:hypothetical protein AVEN_103070-1 [Araneus ventricosus]
MEKSLTQNVDMEESIKMVQESLAKIWNLTKKKNEDSRAPRWNMDLEFTRIKIRALRRRNLTREKNEDSRAPWWNLDLEFTSIKIRALRRRYQRTYNSSERIQRKIIYEN